MGVLVEQRVCQETIPLTVRGGKPEPQHIARDRPADRARHQPAVVGTGIAAIRPRLEHIARRAGDDVDRAAQRVLRSEEHTSELQSLMRISYAVFCLKKKKIKS